MSEQNNYFILKGLIGCDAFDSVYLTPHSNVRLCTWQEQARLLLTTYFTTPAPAGRMFIIIFIAAVTPDTRRWVWSPLIKRLHLQPVVWNTLFLISLKLRFLLHCRSRVSVSGQVMWSQFNTGASLFILAWRQHVLEGGQSVDHSREEGGRVM